MATSNYETVTIPTTSNPFRVIVNGVEYKYEAGATVEVPPEVAAAINASVNAASNLVKPGGVKPPFDASGGSGGGSDFVVNFSTADTQTFTVDKTYAEVIEAIKNGKFVRGILTVTGEMPAFLQLACKGYDGYELVFNQVGTNFGSHIAVLEIIYSEDGIEFNHVDIGKAT